MVGLNVWQVHGHCAPPPGQLSPGASGGGMFKTLMFTKEMTYP